MADEPPSDSERPRHSMDVAAALAARDRGRLARSVGEPPPAIEPPSDRAHTIAMAYGRMLHLLFDFDVLWVDDEHGAPGLMLGCRACGIHDWRPTETRTLLDLVESALGHRQVCP